MSLPRPKKSVRAIDSEGNEQLFFELFLAPGPQEIGVTGDNSYDTLFGSNWCAIVEEDTLILRVFQEVDGQWVDRTDDPRMPPIVGTPLPEGVRRMSFAFDQSARLVVAYEVGDGTVTGTRWDATENQYKQNIDFEGVNPCLLMDATVTFRVPDSDVVIFYQKTNNPNTICYRIQQELYATEHELFSGDGNNWVFDGVQPLNYRYQLLVDNAKKNPSERVLLSGLYPLAVGSFIKSSATPTNKGGYQSIIVKAESKDDLGGQGSPTAYSMYEPAIIELDATNDPLTATATAIASGDYSPAIHEVVLPSNPLVADAALGIEGEYSDVVINTQILRRDLIASAIPTSGGNYEKVI